MSQSRVVRGPRTNRFLRLFPDIYAYFRRGVRAKTYHWFHSRDGAGVILDEGRELIWAAHYECASLLLRSGLVGLHDVDADGAFQSGAGHVVVMQCLDLG